MSTTDDATETLSQRELRNESGRVLRAVSAGQSFVLTNSGVPVARIVPVDAPLPALPITRPARRIGGWSQLRARRAAAATDLNVILDEQRAERW
ncbi:MAG: type II toxin-antitoxin system prevent-host-death family antitoxin [Brachybacterium sp.]|nr:type II toxin-antitoxin system prevent-host-death family antitoxin [Brachybacterium sp.]